MEILKSILTIVQMLAALVLLALVMSQATKSEGLTGTIGGKAESAFRGKPGSEERIQDATKWSAITFLAISLILAIVSSRIVG
jgi:protein translocase SecG subunit